MLTFEHSLNVFILIVLYKNQYLTFLKTELYLEGHWM